MRSNSEKTFHQQTLSPDGYYLRRLIAAAPIASGVQAVVSLIDFKEICSGQHSFIVSDEPLLQQAIDTYVPNRPAGEDVEAAPGLCADADPPLHQLTLTVQALSSHIVRVRMGTVDDLARARDFGMLIPEVLAAHHTPVWPAADLSETAREITARFADVTIRLRRDPFAISISSAEVPAATVETALDDRNVHGLLCTPPPGLLLAAQGAAEACWSWALSPDEHLYGLGERFGSFDHRGEQVTLWNTDAWGTTGAASYKNVPFLHSSRGYGLFFHTPAPITMRLATPSARAGLVQVGEPELDLFIIFGKDPGAILGEYTRLTGRATMPPRWAFGIWLSRCRYQNRAEVEAIAERARAEDIPCDVLHVDLAWLAHPNLSCDFTVNEEAFPDLPGMIRRLGEQGFKVSLWELPYVSAQAPRYQEAAEAGYFLRDEHGEPVGADFGAPPADGQLRAIVDFTNPAARAWWQDLHRPLLRAGVAVFKTDFGEAVPPEARASNGMTGRTLHNLFALLYNAAVHEVIAQETGRPGMVWGRSGWAGTQRYPAQWGGDPKTDVWSMRCSLRGGLNLALSAPGIWAHDIGGFYGPPPSPELYIRWAQFGLLSPLARAHGTTPREPWSFGSEALAIFRRYAKLRIRLNPYLYTLAWEAHERGLPMLRPLALEFPDDLVAARIDDAYLLGADLLIAPVFSDSHEPVARRLYLPAGEWIDFWTDERIRGGRFITRLAALDTIPVYVRAGAILPLGPERSFIGEEAPERLSLEVYTGAAGTTRVVWDATGAATELHLYRIKHAHTGQGWQLAIHGDHAAAWSVRWHSDQGTAETAVGRATRATINL